MTKQYGTPGPRFIYPDACTSRSLALCDPLAQLLFDRLLTQCDDQGRLEADPAVVKALCMPLIAKATVRAVERWLEELEREDMIRRYSQGGRPLIQMTNWWSYQGGMRRSYPSRWPAPKGWDGDRIRGVVGENDGGTPPADGGSGGQSPPLARAGAEPSRTEPNRSPAEPNAAGSLPTENDLATAACRLLPDGGRWLGDVDYTGSWDELERRYKEWGAEELQPAYAELVRRGKVRAWDLKRIVEFRCAERARKEEHDRLAAQRLKDEEETGRLREQQTNASPEERERQDLYRRALQIWRRGGARGKVPEKLDELRAWLSSQTEEMAS
jgi:hypothetical protein